MAIHTKHLAPFHTESPRSIPKQGGVSRGPSAPPKAPGRRTNVMDGMIAPMRRGNG